jgi:Ni/Fe-hydrogenase subunit HybB-like protein
MEAMRRRNTVKDILWVFVTIGLVAAVVRFGRGLGATTGLSDAAPWGIWIGFDVMGGVALAAGGFVIAATVYIFHLEKYRPLLRPAVLTAFLGYLAVIFGLLCDLGLPWHIWEPIVNWQHHSVLFEVAWCVMLYTTVLALEFSPTVLEHPWFRAPIFQRLAHWLKRLTLPLVIAGIVLSTMHQSSLGSLVLIMPSRLHPLWYSPIMPVLFFVSAVTLGLAVVTLEGFVSAYLYGHSFKPDLFAGLGRAAAWLLWLYLALRLGDLALRGVLGAALDGSWQSVLFLFEVGAAALLPAVLLSLRSVRASPRWLVVSAGLVAFGMALNRLSVALVAQHRPPGTTYSPTWMELAITFGIISAAGLAFLFFAENLKVFSAEEKEHEPARPSPYDKPAFDPATTVCLGNSLRETVARRSLFLLIVAALAVALLPERALSGRLQPSTPVKAALGWETMLINGDRDEMAVVFDHLGHQERLRETRGDEGCQVCHHLDKPGDWATPCWECHRDMFLPTSIFDHALHQAALGGNSSCGLCHIGEHTPDTAKPCAECHDTMAPQAGETSFNYLATGYQEAMHGTCLACHEQEAQEQDRPELGRCPTCHKPPTTQER